MNCKDALRLIIEKGWLKPINLSISTNTKEKTDEIAKLVSFLIEFNKGYTSTPYCDCEEALKLIIKNNLFKDIVVTTANSLEDTELADYLKNFRESLNLKNNIKFASSKPATCTIDTESFEVKKDNFGFISIKSRQFQKFAILMLELPCD